MKNTTLFFFCFLFCSVIYSQNNLVPCNHENPSNWFENGLKNSAESGFVVANDITLNASESFTLQQIIYHSFHDVSETISSVDVIYYNDDNGLPGEVIGNETGIVPSSLIEMGDFGIDIFEVTLDISPFYFAGEVGTEKTYWIGLVGHSSEGGDLWWETSSATSNGFPAAQSNGGVYSIVDPAFDGVYNWSGECEFILEVPDNLENLIGVYPNPTSTELNIAIPTSIDVQNVMLLDILGNNTGIKWVDGKIDTSALSEGVYFLMIETSEGLLTKKIIKADK